MLLASIDYECEAEFYHLSSSDLFYTKEIVSGWSWGAIFTMHT